MRIGIGIILIAVGSIVFTVLLRENTPWILLTSPFFIIGHICIQSKIHEMEDNILSLEAKLNVFILKEQKSGSKMEVE
jgi:hypothetical protein